MESYVILWIAIAAGFVILEVVTMAFVAMYFAVGAGAAALVAGLDGGLTWQLLAFAVTGIVLMLLTRPLLKGKLESPKIATNVDRMAGKGGIVTIAIDNLANTGQIRVGTEYWTARVADGAPEQIIPVDARVTVQQIEGVTARVLPRVETPNA